MPPDENEGPQPRFPDPGRDETRYRPPRPPADLPAGRSPSYPPRQRRLGCLPAIILIVLLIFLILLALDLLGVIDILSR
jgi:hypothetical protein